MISRNFCKNMVRVNLPNFKIVVLHAVSVNFPSKQILLKISIPSIFDELLSLLCCSKFLSSISWRQHVHLSKLIWRKIYDAPWCCCHFQEIFRERDRFFSNCAIHFMYLLCYDLPFAPVFYIQCFAFRRGNVWLMGNFNVP